MFSSTLVVSRLFHLMLVYIRLKLLLKPSVDDIEFMKNSSLT